MSQSYPVDALPSKSREVLKEQAIRAEKDGKMTKAQLSLIQEHKWFKIFIPTAYGGLQMALPESLALLESLAAADGSLSWLITMCSLAGWHAAFVEPETANELFAPEIVSICGNDNATCMAEKGANGYTVNGVWQYTCGAAEATAFIAKCSDGRHAGTTQSPNADLAFALLKQEFTVAAKWNAIGLVATGSYDLEANDIKVPDGRTFKVNSEYAKVKGALYQFPYAQIAEAATAVNVAGMAQHFTELARTIFAEITNQDGMLLTDDLNVQETLRKQTQKFTDARTKLYYAVELSWQAAVNGQRIKPAILYKVSSAAAELTRRSRECVNALFPYCGMMAADKTTAINRVWRDMHTAGQYRIPADGLGQE
ncbi:MAG: acyl-CoA dehydrogenase family protein [Bacteroidota bacterium]